MVSIIERKASGNGNYLYKAVGLSSDVKPILTNGSSFEEMDTGDVYRFNEESRGWIGKADKYLASIDIISAPTKTAYLEGASFEADGLKVQATYTDGSAAEVEGTVRVSDPLTVEDKAVEISYIENGIIKKASQEITVSAPVATDEDSFKFVLAEGDEVTLESDIPITEQATVNHDFVLNLNGHKITSDVTTGYPLVASGATLTITGDGEIKTKNRIATARDGGTLIIENGTFESENVSFDATGAGTKVVINDGLFSSAEGIAGAFDGAEVEVNGGDFKTSDNFVLFTNGTKGRGGNTIILNGGNLIGNIASEGYEAIGVYIANNDTFVMNGGTIHADGGAGILMRGGSVTINDGEIVATTGPNVPGWIGDKKVKMSASGVIYDWNAKYPGRDGMNLTINGGKITGADHAVEVLSDEEIPAVTIKGGVFTPEYPEASKEETDGE